jgi:lipopolysaccharide transport system permease protein
MRAWLRRRLGEGSNLRTFLDQVIELTRVRLNARYRGTWAGVLWVAISPISLFVLQAAVFSALLKGTGEDYTPYLLTGLFPWFFITQSIDMGSGLIVNQGGLLKSLHLHPRVIIAALILDNFIIFMGSMTLASLVYLIIYHRWHWSVMLILFPSFVLAVWTFSITWIVSILNVFFRDTKFVVSFLLQIFFFLTPIFYRETVPIPLIRQISRYNALRVLIDPFRDCVLSIDLHQIIGNTLWAGLISLITFVIAVQFWRKTRNAVYFRI